MFTKIISNINAVKTKAQLVEILEQIKDSEDLTDFCRSNLNEIYHKLEMDIGWNIRDIHLSDAKKRAICSIY